MPPGAILVLASLFLSAPFAFLAQPAPEGGVLLVGYYDDAPESVDGGFVVQSASGAALIDAIDVEAMIAELKADPRVRYVERDVAHYARVQLVPNDAWYGDYGHYHTKLVGAEAAWDRTLGSSAVKVAVIDTGLRRSHEDFAGPSRIAAGFDLIDGDNDPNDTCGHGTHVAGTLGATTNNGRGVAGVAQATIIPIKAMAYYRWYGCTGELSTLVSAVRLAADQGAHIVSNSWAGGQPSAAMDDAIQYARSRGALVVGAAGNVGPCANCVQEPWRSNGAKTLVVGATDASDRQASFSAEGPEIDITAPGVSITSTYASHDRSYARLSGTSMATPIVSGVAALAKSLEPGLTATQLEARLTATAVDLGAPGKDHKFGHGRVNADAATSSGSAPPPPPNDPPPPTEVTLLSEGFEGGADGWSATHGALWHLESGCVAPASGARTLAWTRAGHCDYNAGGRVSDYAMTPAIDLSGRTQATLSFAHRFDIEQYASGTYDILRVEVSSNNGASWTTLKEWNSRGADVAAWRTESYDLAAYAGRTIHVRFWTDTVDGYANAQAGWFVDDVKLVAR